MFGEFVLSYSKRVGALQKFGETVLITAKRVKRLQKFGESVLTTAKRVEDLQTFPDSDLTAVNHVGCLQKFGESVFATTCRRHVEVQRVRFDLPQSVLDACRSSVSPFQQRQQRVGVMQKFRKSVLTAAKRVGCFVEVWSPFQQPKQRVGGIQKFGESVLTSAKRVGSFQNFGESVFIWRSFMQVRNLC